MSQNKTTTSTNQYNQNALGAYNSMIPQASSALSSEINDPYSNSFFTGQVGMMNQQIGAQGASAQSAINQSLQARGLQGNSPLAAFMSRQAANQTQASQAQGYNSLLLNAANMRQSAIGGALSFNPLQTGQTQVQQQSGLGTWLPQVIGAGLGAAGMAMGMPPGGGGAMSNLGGNFGGNQMLSNYASGGAPQYADPAAPSMFFQPNTGNNLPFSTASPAIY